MSSCANLTGARGDFHVLRRWLRRAPMLLMIVSLAPAGALAQTTNWRVLPPGKQLLTGPPHRHDFAGRRQHNLAGRL